MIRIPIQIQMIAVLKEITENDADDKDSFDDGDDLFDNLVNISASMFHEIRLFDSVNNSILTNERLSPSDQAILSPSRRHTH